MTFNLLDRPVLKNAYVIPQGPSTLIIMNADKLAAEHQADWKAADERYRIDKASGKSLLITGKVVKKSVQGTQGGLYLGREDAQVICQFYGYEAAIEKALGPIEVGQTVTVAGMWQTNQGKTEPPKSARLTACNMVK